MRHFFETTVEYLIQSTVQRSLKNGLLCRSFLLFNAYLEIWLNFMTCILNIDIVIFSLEFNYINVFVLQAPFKLVSDLRYAWKKWVYNYCKLVTVFDIDLKRETYNLWTLEVEKSINLNNRFMIFIQRKTKAFSLYTSKKLPLMFETKMETWSLSCSIYKPD